MDRSTLDGVPEVDRFWTFTLNASANYVTHPDGTLAGVQDLRFFLFGQHLKGHPGTVNPNGLELIATDPAISANAGEAFRYATYKEVKHPGTDGTQGIDSYGVYGDSKVGNSPLNPLVHPAKPAFESGFNLNARHEDKSSPAPARRPSGPA